MAVIGITRHTPGRTTTLTVTAAGVTGRITPTASNPPVRHDRTSDTSGGAR
ncbi:hypothetical protein [Streptomyces sp. NPDC047000]|uniref:hypothetical protein n=1 Tax=Streptomyces sp. NPDC047000 TaxID=3155474 RepID=UPI0033CDF195